MKTETTKVVFLNLFAMGSKYSTVITEYGLLYFNAKYNVITTKTVAILFGILIFTSIILFSVKLTIKGYSIEKLVHKIMKPERIHQKISFWVFRYIVFFTPILFFCFSLWRRFALLNSLWRLWPVFILGILITHFSVLILP
jgi:hypothetical protein